MRRLGLACWIGFALGGCAQGSVLTPLTGSLFAVGSYDGGALDSNGASGGSDLVFAGQGFTGNAGQQMFAVVIDASSNQLLTQQAGFAPIDAGGNFQLSWKNLVVPGQQLYVAYYADVDKNAICNATPTDNGWEVRLTTLEAGTVVAVTPDVQQRPVCELFGTYDMAFDRGTGLSGHGYPGHRAYAVVLDALDDSLVGEALSATISDSGNVTFSWPGLLVSHHRYITAVCVDTADNGTCDSTAEYTFMTGPVSANVATTFSNATAVPPATFGRYWPQNLSLPPPLAVAIPSLNAQ